ncbi:MAG: cold shock domain-containing protein [Candidatus Woesearchaeota archaeon]|nr:MAG: cold shock domain-containing protein [Candidatus Woesearchaeota archaeon]
MKGTVKWFNSRKGFGFIQGEDGKDYFVHFTEVPKDTRLVENDSVEFEAAKTDKGEQAKKVRLLGKGSATSGGDSKDQDFEEQGSEEEFVEEE